MKKFVFIPIIILLAITLIGFNVFNSKPEVPIELVAFESLTNKEKDLIPVSPKDSLVQKVTVNTEIKSKIDKNYEKKEVYVVTFRHSEADSSGNLEVYIALDKKTVVGKKHQ
ncbi:hypothetical protein [Mesobacillus subterraneus]|uniref:Uncharacterized protein n=1 Tax=Mesobacillus subterraneus TaxID=285983 RepID=A0A3R9EB06_9BACI|nr:hypothetical protein [Mesobacillus subterraneus]RSD27817.1 hypothetical protein EJA10_08570 [Mesobacillus subterraneus]